MMRIAMMLWREEKGATMVEYGLMLALVAFVCVAAIAFLGTSARDLFGNATLLGAL